MKNIMSVVALSTLLASSPAWAQSSGGTPAGPSGTSVGQGTGGGPTARECERAETARFTYEELQTLCKERGYRMPEKK